MTFPAGISVYGTRLSYIIAVVVLYIIYFAIYKYKVNFFQICQKISVRLSVESSNIHQNTNGGDLKKFIIAIDDKNNFWIRFGFNSIVYIILCYYLLKTFSICHNYDKLYF